MAPKRNEPVFAIDPHAQAFAALLETHAKHLRLKISELFVETTERGCGLPVDLSYYKRWKDGERGVSRELAARFAITIVREYVIRRANGEKFPNLPVAERITAAGWEHVGWALEHFFTTAGLVSRPLKISEPQNILWSQIRDEDLQGRILKIGWVECVGWAYGPLKGPCIQIATMIAGFLGLKPEFIRFEHWADLSVAIAARDIHVTAPIMIETPDRLWDFLFSDQVEGLAPFQIGILIDKTQADLFEISLTNDCAEMMLGYVAGEIGQLAARLLPDEATLKWDDMESAMQWLKNGSQKDKRLFAGEKGTLERKAKSDPNLRVIEAQELSGARFPVCFAAHVDEPNLIHAVNAALKIATPRIRTIFQSP